MDAANPKSCQARQRCLWLGGTGSTIEADFYLVEVELEVSSLNAFMEYLINLSEESDHLLRQLCDSGHKLQSDAVSPEEFLSAFVEEQLDGLFPGRERRKAGKTKKVGNAVRFAKERAKTWSEAVVATHTALEAMRKLVKEANTNRRPGLDGTPCP